MMTSQISGLVRDSCLKWSTFGNIECTLIHQHIHCDLLLTRRGRRVSWQPNLVQSISFLCARLMFAETLLNPQFVVTG